MKRAADRRDEGGDPTPRAANDPGTLAITRATPADLETVASILEEAAAWLIERGIPQWPATFPRAPLREHIARGEFFLARLGGQAAGTLMLIDADPEIWGAQPPDALYLHSFAVRRSAAGQGLGQAMLDWAAGQAAAAGKRYLRLDCWAGSAPLRAYYAGAGFTFRGETTEGHWQCALFERPAAAGGE